MPTPTNMPRIWERYGMAQSYATMLPGRESGMVHALQMAQSVRSLTGSGVLLGEPRETAEAFEARIVATVSARMVALSLRD